MASLDTHLHQFLYHGPHSLQDIRILPCPLAMFHKQNVQKDDPSCEQQLRLAHIQLPDLERPVYVSSVELQRAESIISIASLRMEIKFFLSLSIFQAVTLRTQESIIGVTEVCHICRLPLLLCPYPLPRGTPPQISIPIL